MKSRRKPWTSVIAAALVAGGVTYAQVPSKQEPEPPAKPLKLDKLSLSEMVAHAETVSAQIKADVRHVLHLQTKTRQAKDVIKLNCVNDKLVQVKAQVNIFDSARASLAAGLEEGASADDRRATFTAATESGGAIRNLRAEADACVGEPELFQHETNSEVQRPRIVDDPAATDPFATGGFEAPAYASPFN